jgi:hypothetical protein
VDLLPLNVPASREQALVRLRGRGVAAWYRGWRRGPLAGVRPVQVPYRLFEVRISNAGRLDRRWLAIDAVSGVLDCYGFPAPPDAGALERSADAGALPEVVAPERLRGEVIERVRRQVYATGFFRLRGLRIEVDDTRRVLYLPYWVGVRRKGDRHASIEVLGGLRGSREGGKLKDLIATWLAA